MDERFTLSPRYHADRSSIEADAWYSVGRDDPTGPWLVFERCESETHAARLDMAAPRAVAAGYLGTRRGEVILAGLEVST